MPKWPPVQAKPIKIMGAILIGSLLLLVVAVAIFSYKLQSRNSTVELGKEAAPAVSLDAITSEEAVEMVRKLPKVVDYMERVPKGIVTADREDIERNLWIVHVYEVVREHTATYNWYEVDKNSGEITPLFEFDF